MTTSNKPQDKPRPLFKATSAAVRKRMQSVPQRDTSAELRIRRLLHATGLRYTIDAKPLDDSRGRADIVFRRARIAVFVDGCFWHGCPDHGTWPKANAQVWRSKILANVERDANTDARLQQEGWAVIRVWEHEDPGDAAKRIDSEVRARLVKARRR